MKVVLGARGYPFMSMVFLCPTKCLGGGRWSGRSIGAANAMIDLFVGVVFV